MFGILKKKVCFVLWLPQIIIICNEKVKLHLCRLLNFSKLHFMHFLRLIGGHLITLSSFPFMNFCRPLKKVIDFQILLSCILDLEKCNSIFTFVPIITFAHWGKNPHFIQKFTFLKSHLLTKIAFSKSYFSKKSHFRSPFFIKIAFSKPHYSQRSHFQNWIFRKNHIIKANFHKKLHF